MHKVIRQLHNHAREVRWPGPVMFLLVDEPDPVDYEKAVDRYGKVTPLLAKLSGYPRFRTR